MRRWLSILALGASVSAQPKAMPQKPSPEAASWWGQTTALANDGMEGRDTGTAAYERAAKYVAEQFAAAGLKPMGDGGTFFQRVPMREVDVDPAASSLIVRNPAGTEVKMRFTTEITTVPRGDLSVEAPMVFVGYGLPAAGTDLKGKIAVFFNNTPAGLEAAERESYPARRLRALNDARAAAILSIDNPAAIEPFHWPAAYARSVVLAGGPVAAMTTPPIVRVNSEFAEALFRADDPRRMGVVAKGGRGEFLDSFPMGLSALLEIHTHGKDISSPNVLAVLPGSDLKLAGEFAALSAHLDGYGYGTPVGSDTLYNGALDDAAYVALLIEVAKDLHAKAPGRSLLFCAFTGEEKGLLGSAWFTAHPTVPVEKIVADLNLDQLRPIFPLKILTMEGIDDSTLGATVKGLAAQFGIEMRPDREPERNLFRRADNYNFVKVGVPIASFIFGYDPGSAEEKVYRDWYARRYHKPQDDLQTPIDWEAAVKFNRFYERLAVTVANAPMRPAWLSGSPYAPK